MNPGSIGFVIICAAFVFFTTPGCPIFTVAWCAAKTRSTPCCLGGNHRHRPMGFDRLFPGVWEKRLRHKDFIGNLRLTRACRCIEGCGICQRAGDPQYVFCLFQMMFAVITPALITQAAAWRMRFQSLLIFLLLWSLIVYCPMAHMVWADAGFRRRSAPAPL